jgi:hypothetical protein
MEEGVYLFPFKNVAFGTSPYGHSTLNTLPVVSSDLELSWADSWRKQTRQKMTFQEQIMCFLKKKRIEIDLEDVIYF